MDEIANKLTVDKKDEMNAKQNNDLQSNVKVSQMADILVSKFKQGLETPAKQRVVRFYLEILELWIMILIRIHCRQKKKMF